MNLIQVETQTDFPTKDISDAAAAMLELLLLNRELVNAYHNSAEMVSFLYRLVTEHSIWLPIHNLMTVSDLRRFLMVLVHSKQSLR